MPRLVLERVMMSCHVKAGRYRRRILRGNAWQKNSREQRGSTPYLVRPRRDNAHVEGFLEGYQEG